MQEKVSPARPCSPLFDMVDSDARDSVIAQYVMASDGRETGLQLAEIAEYVWQTVAHNMATLRARLSTQLSDVSGVSREGIDPHFELIGTCRTLVNVYRDLPPSCIDHIRAVSGVDFKSIGSDLERIGAGLENLHPSWRLFDLPPVPPAKHSIWGKLSGADEKRLRDISERKSLSLILCRAVGDLHNTCRAGHSLWTADTSLGAGIPVRKKLTIKAKAAKL